MALDQLEQLTHQQDKRLCALPCLMFILGILIINLPLQAQASNRQILFLADYEGSTALYTMQPDGTNIEKLVDSGQIEESGEITSASLSPDGTMLAIASSKIRTDHHTDEIFLRDMATGIVIPLTNDGRNNTLPQWSPDSQYLAYLMGSGINGFETVYVAAIAAQEITVVTTANALYPILSTETGLSIRNLDWSPDGSQLVLSGQTGLPDAFNILLVVNADGTEARQITTNEMDVGVDVSWGSDANLIFSPCRINNHSELCQFNLQTSQLEVLTDLETAISRTRSPYVTGLDVASNGDIVFQYGVVDSTFYVYDIVNGSVTEILTDADPHDENMIELIGWIELPKD